MYGVQVLWITGKPGCIEVGAYIDGQPAARIQARVYREGVAAWPVEVVSSQSGYLKVCGLAAGEYRLDLVATAPDGKQAARSVELSLGEGERKRYTLISRCATIQQ